MTERSYQELQALAKEHGIRANQKREVLEEQLAERLNIVQRQSPTKERTTERAISDKSEAELRVALAEPLLYDYLATALLPGDWAMVEKELERMNRAQTIDDTTVGSTNDEQISLGRIFLDRTVEAAYPTLSRVPTLRGVPTLSRTQHTSRQRKGPERPEQQWLLSYPYITRALAILSPEWRDYVVSYDVYPIIEVFAPDLETTERLYLVTRAQSIAAIEALLDPLPNDRIARLYESDDLLSPDLVYIYLLSRKIVPSSKGLRKVLETGDVDLAERVVELDETLFTDRGSVLDAIISARSSSLLQWFVRLQKVSEWKPTIAQFKRAIQTTSAPFVKVLLSYYDVIAAKHSPTEKKQMWHSVDGFLPLAIKKGEKEMVELLIDRANSNVPFEQFMYDGELVNALEYAAALGTVSVARYLLERYEKDLTADDWKRLNEYASDKNKRLFKR